MTLGQAIVAAINNLAPGSDTETAEEYNIRYWDAVGMAIANWIASNP